MATDRHPGLEARRLRPAGPPRAQRRDESGDRPALAGAQPRTTPPASRSVNAEAIHTADPAKLGGAVFVDLGRAVKEHPELLEQFLLTDAVTPRDDAFAALHAAFWTGGTLLYVPKGCQGRGPAVQPGRAGPRGAGRHRSYARSCSKRGPRRRWSARHRSATGPTRPRCTSGPSSSSSAGGRRLRFVNIQNWDGGTWHFSRERALVGPDAALQWTVGGLGSRLAKVNQEVALTGEGARAQVNGVMFTTGRQHLAYFTRQDHQAPHTISDLLYKGGLKDRSRVVWKGMIRVEKDAQRTNAYQKNDNLILSETARADSIPGLEIEANDVRCTHGATAGRVDEDMIFYAQSRGVSSETAIRLIVEGFFANVYDRITLEPVRETLRQAVADKLQFGTTTPA